jgi:hypothetical protein
LRSHAESIECDIRWLNPTEIDVVRRQQDLLEDYGKKTEKTFYVVSQGLQKQAMESAGFVRTLANLMLLAKESCNFLNYIVP